MQIEIALPEAALILDALTAFPLSMRDPRWGICSPLVQRIAQTARAAGEAERIADDGKKLKGEGSHKQ
jgi:hypothetical protein